ncbi:protein hunchback-like [Sitophilus oryzae]|uniref:Protein hunchback n=1 Tax=Sitophilus oryzae TaxID=7048 RepID=A0A6J2YQE6_SITOR|nr:protein hunchback-like [Sitophilus oryzae]
MVGDTEMSSDQVPDKKPTARRPRKQSNPRPTLSPDTPWDYPNTIVKQEPMEDTRTDSGVSENDYPSASPESDRSSQVHAYHNNNLSMPSTSAANESSMNNMDLSSQHLENSSNNDQADINQIKFNSNGKGKEHKCKHCPYVAITKEDYWEHLRIHIEKEKLLTCKTCPFVTKYKHHMDYHINNHKGIKPHHCDSCNYSSLTLSMLQSHKKTHWEIYPYRCADCPYGTKHLHTFKMHLRKKGHQPGVVLNPDGTPNPEPVIDVYGTRRGPRSKRPSLPSTISVLPKSPSPKSQHPYASSLPCNPVPRMVPFPLPLLPAFPLALPNPELLQNIQFIRENFEQWVIQNDKKSEIEEGVLDLSKPPSRCSEFDSEEEEPMSTAFANVEVVDDVHDSNITETYNKDQNENNDRCAENRQYGFHCHYCKIGFSEEVLFRIHIGFHGVNNPFACSICGEECENSVYFFLHIAKYSH